MSERPSDAVAIAILTLMVVACASPQRRLVPRPEVADPKYQPDDSGSDILQEVQVLGLDSLTETGEGQLETIQADVTQPEPPPSPQPCISVTPQSVNFGGKKMGEVAMAPVEIQSCNGASLALHHIGLQEGSSPEFGVISNTPDFLPSSQKPIVLEEGETATVLVTYSPAEMSPIDEDGNLILSEAVVEIHSNADTPAVEIPVSGASPDCCCPTAIIKCSEGDEVNPQTMLHLEGDDSYSANGTIQKWQWEVEQPAGSQSVFVPAQSFPNPSFETNVAGLYTFFLTVWNENGSVSCFPATYEVLVIPDYALHVELLWHTPGDPDEADTGPEAGADMDLHFLHPWAAGPDLDGDGIADGWFDIPFDAFWFNPHPNWGSYDPGFNDDPGLDRDDTDGAGPENLNLDVPENVTYRVGIHYWNDHGYGLSIATLRVYIYSQMVFEANATLMDSDMWEVCTIQWPSGQVKPVTVGEGDLKIVPFYQNPYFFP